MKSLTLCLSGVEQQDLTRFRRLFGKLRSQLPTDWRLLDEGEADLTVVDVDSVYGHMDWLTLTGRGARVAAYTSAENSPDSMALFKPLQEDNLLRVLNAVAVEQGLQEPSSQAGLDQIDPDEADLDEADLDEADLDEADQARAGEDAGLADAAASSAEPPDALADEPLGPQWVRDLDAADDAGVDDAAADVSAHDSGQPSLLVDAAGFESGTAESGAVESGAVEFGTAEPGADVHDTALAGDQPEPLAMPDEVAAGLPMAASGQRPDESPVQVPSGPAEQVMDTPLGSPSESPAAAEVEQNGAASAAPASDVGDEVSLADLVQQEVGSSATPAAHPEFVAGSDLRPAARYQSGPVFQTEYDLQLRPEFDMDGLPAEGAEPASGEGEPQQETPRRETALSGPAQTVASEASPAPATSEAPRAAALEGDASPAQWLETVAEKNTVQTLRAWLLKADARQALRVDVAAETWHLDPAHDNYYGPRELKPLAPALEEPVEDLAEVEPATLTQMREGSEQPMSRLRWYAGLTATPGQLHHALDPQGAFKLVRWPRIEREYPRHFRVATALMKNPDTVARVAAESGALETDVIDFINACHAIGVIEQVSAADPQDDAPRRGGMMSRLRKPRGR